MTNNNLIISVRVFPLLVELHVSEEHFHNMLKDYKMTMDNPLIDNLLAKQLLDKSDEMYVEKADVFLLQH